MQTASMQNTIIRISHKILDVANALLDSIERRHAPDARERVRAMLKNHRATLSCASQKCNLSRARGNGHAGRAT